MVESHHSRRGLMAHSKFSHIVEIQKRPDLSTEMLYASVLALALSATLHKLPEIHHSCPPGLLEEDVECFA